MSRDLPPELKAAVKAGRATPFLALYIATLDPVRVWTGEGTIAFTDNDGVGQDWIGAEGIGALDTVGESTDGSAMGMKATLFSVPAEHRPNLDRQGRRGDAFEIYLGVIELRAPEDSPEGWQPRILGTVLLWKGRLDTYKITDDGASISVEVTGESRAIDGRRPSIKRFTDEWQQRRHPGDKFFEYVDQMAEIKVLLAGASQSPAGGSSSGSRSGGGSAHPV